ncbi:MAG: hypothetical protein AB7N24_18630 [Dehalococcoidia bacterium]
MSLSALFVALLLLAIGIAGCGGDDDDDAADPGTTTGGATTAAELAPGRSVSSFAVAESGRVPGSTQNQDTFYGIYVPKSPGAVQTMRVEINMQPNVEQATAQYGPLSEALRNPPPDLFGAGATQVDGTPAYQADQSKSYRTEKPDGQGYYVFSDIHRMGRAVVIIYAIGPDTKETADARKKVAEDIAAKAK